MSHLTLTEVGQHLDRTVTLDSSAPTVGDGDALVVIEAGQGEHRGHLSSHLRWVREPTTTV